jgi:hypothetical protein
MLAVLIDAVRALSIRESPTPSIRAHRELFKDRTWFMSGERAQLFSFLNICDSLGLDPDYIRRCVLKRTAAERPIRVRRYAAKAEDAWQRQRKNQGLIVLPVSHAGREAYPQQRSAVG